MVHEDCFKDIYAKFFPHGSKYLSVSMCVCVCVCEFNVLAGIVLVLVLFFYIRASSKRHLSQHFIYVCASFWSSSPLTAFRTPQILSDNLNKIISILADSSLYAHYVFKAFDVNCNGAISFRVIISLCFIVYYIM